MNVHALTAAPGPELAAALARFEEQFTYPLGPGRSFRISHGADYPRFFRAVGAAVCFVAERGGEVLGVLGLAATRVYTADDTERPAIYLGDLKVAPAARGGRVLTRMADAAGEWCRARAACGFGVVMDGTRVTPDRYTGRLGIPPFRETAKIAVLRLPTSVLTSSRSRSHAADCEASQSALRASTKGEVAASLWTRRVGGEPLRAPISPSPPPGSQSLADLPLQGGGQEECFAHLAAGRVHTDGGNPAERSETSPLWLVAPDGSACGRFEDTRCAKRLIANDGEMLAAHLSCIGYASHAALAELFRVARGVAAERGFPALFAAVPANEADDVLAHLNEPGVVVAPATVFASGFEPGEVWSINTAEI